MTAPSLSLDYRPAASRTLPELGDGRSRAQAWGLALAAHGVLIALALVGLERAGVEAPPEMVRLVFVEPPPPPPPLVGAPGGSGSLAALPVAPARPETQPAPEVKPRPAVAKPKPKAKAKPPTQPQPRAVPPPAPAVAAPAPEPVAVQAGSIAGSAAGAPAGVSGGVAGGQVGGVVGGRGIGPVPAGQVANPPTLVSRVSPDYPRAARLAGVEGLVLLEAILDTDGRIESEIEVLRSVPHLDDAAVAALRRWRFKPARDERGQAVSVILEVPIRFVLR